VESTLSLLAKQWVSDGQSIGPMLSTPWIVSCTVQVAPPSVDARMAPWLLALATTAPAQQCIESAHETLEIADSSTRLTGTEVVVEEWDIGAVAFVPQPARMTTPTIRGLIRASGRALQYAIAPTGLIDSQAAG
jgi:hypothetical protein